MKTLSIIVTLFVISIEVSVSRMIKPVENDWKVKIIRHATKLSPMIMCKLISCCPYHRPFEIINKKCLQPSDMKRRIAKYKRFGCFHLCISYPPNFESTEWSYWILCGIKMANQICVLVFVLSIVSFVVAQESQLQSQPQPQVVRETNNNDGSGNYLFT